MSRHNEPEQIRISFPSDRFEGDFEVLDLFAGIGGLSLGFRASGFRVIGVDNEAISAEVFRENNIGELVRRNLHSETELRDVPVVIGGPPCRPWSAVNLQRRGAAHDDHVLLEKFFFHVAEIRPQVFLMENVPPIVSDPEYKRLVREIREDGYTTSAAVLRYSDFGAATTRRRLFTVGFRDSGRWDAAEFFQRLDTYKQAFRTVRDKIAWLSSAPRGSVPDHDWSNVRTIEKYAERYRTGQYGWKQLSWDEPAPSFGSVAKTYILHPAAGKDGFPLRVLSVREVLSIMGFGRSFHFPTGTALHTRYRMAANAVSPTISAICGRVAMDMLTGLPAHNRCATHGSSP